jgi:hypothetical protein
VDDIAETRVREFQGLRSSHERTRLSTVVHGCLLSLSADAADVGRSLACEIARTACLLMHVASTLRAPKPKWGLRSGTGGKGCGRIPERQSLLNWRSSGEIRMNRQKTHEAMAVEFRGKSLTTPRNAESVAPSVYISVSSHENAIAASAPAKDREAASRMDPLAERRAVAKLPPPAVPPQWTDLIAFVSVLATGVLLVVIGHLATGGVATVCTAIAALYGAWRRFR